MSKYLLVAAALRYRRSKRTYCYSKLEVPTQVVQTYWNRFHLKLDQTITLNNLFKTPTWIYNNI